MTLEYRRNLDVFKKQTVSAVFSYLLGILRSVYLPVDHLFVMRVVDKNNENASSTSAILWKECTRKFNVRSMNNLTLTNKNTHGFRLVSSNTGEFKIMSATKSFDIKEIFTMK
ncbi:MAG: hypothetical protein IJ165_05350 [Proteobacteria bacterium]|nr:hypothetical protein [Pseudomonadota bacterium]